ncbi:MAG: D-alanyl-D-alanine carboxypeptidase [Ruminococcaceae bacterium]|nr:D-alanyl-D-alanine carboxypeptidase [Oscillospiraceae bacterium]
MKKIVSVFICVIILSFSLLSVPSSAATYKPDFEVTAKGVYLVNLDTDTVIYEKDAHKKLYPASLTKIMTCLLLCEMVPDLDNTVITAKAAILGSFSSMNVSLAGILAGEELTARELLYCMLLQSGNEAAAIVADYLGDQSINNFIDMMNARAKELGAVNTHFVNPHGLHDDDHYTTAYDLYLIAKEAIKHEEILEIASVYSYQLRKTNRRDPEWLVSTNKMMLKSSPYYRSYIKGLKTGTTTPAGKCFAAYAEKNGYHYLSILLGSAYKDEKGNVYSENYVFSETAKLLDWAFEKFSLKTLLPSDKFCSQIPLRLSSESDSLLLYPKEKILALIPDEIDPSSVQVVPHTNTYAQAPIKKGDVLGYVEVKLADEVVGITDLVAGEDIERNEFLYLISLVKNIFTSVWIKLAVVLLILFALIYVLLIIRQEINSQRYRSIIKKRRF